MQLTSELDDITRHHIRALVTEAEAVVPREGDWPRRVALEIVLGLSEMGLVPERQLPDAQIGRLAEIVLKGLPPMEIGLMILQDLIQEGQTPVSPG